MERQHRSLAASKGPARRDRKDRPFWLLRKEETADDAILTFLDLPELKERSVRSSQRKQHVVRSFLLTLPGGTTRSSSESPVRTRPCRSLRPDGSLRNQGLMATQDTKNATIGVASALMVLWGRPVRAEPERGSLSGGEWCDGARPHPVGRRHQPFLCGARRNSFRRSACQPPPPMRRGHEVKALGGDGVVTPSPYTRQVVAEQRRRELERRRPPAHRRNDLDAADATSPRDAEPGSGDAAITTGTTSTTRFWRPFQAIRRSGGRRNRDLA